MFKYCGPYWSAGKIQKSVRSEVPPDNALDECCMFHDAGFADYSSGEVVDLNAVDTEFIRCASQQGLLGGMMAIAVAGSRALRIMSSSPADDFSMTKAKMKASGKPSLRGAVKAPKKLQRAESATSIGALQLSAPAAISSVFTSTPTKTKNIKNGIAVAGKEFIGTVEGKGVSTFGLGKSALISPSYFYGGVLGQLARSFTRYRFTKLVVHYIPKVSTSSTGQVVLCSQENVTMPCLSGESSSFLQRALVSGNGVMCPVWSPCRMQIKTDGKYRFIDAFTNADINENIFCEVQCYSQIGVTAQVGYLWLEYECDLIENMLEPHASLMPVSTGPGSRASFADKSTTPTAGDPAVFNETSSLSLSSFANGTIFRFVVDLQATGFGAGQDASNAYKVSMKAVTAAAGTVGVGFTPNVLVGGTTWYLVVTGSDFYVYTSLEAAIAGVGSGQLYYSTSATTKSTPTGDLTLVRYGAEPLDNVQ